MREAGQDTMLPFSLRTCLLLQAADILDSSRTLCVCMIRQPRMRVCVRGGGRVIMQR